MRRIGGIVCIADSRKRLKPIKTIYGAPGNELLIYEPFLENGLSAFGTIESAEPAVISLRRRKEILQISLMRIVWEIGENNQDLLDFQKSRPHSFVIISTSKFAGGCVSEAYGPSVSFEECAPLLPCASLSRNGLRSFRSFSETLKIAEEVARQSQTQVRIARTTSMLIAQYPKP